MKIDLAIKKSSESIDAKLRSINDSFRAQFPSNNYASPVQASDLWVSETYDGFVIVRLNDKSYRVKYSMTGDSPVFVSRDQWVEVKQETDWVDVTSGMKAGARNSARDAERLQAIHDLAVENGAVCHGEEHPSARDAMPSINLDLAKVPMPDGQAMGGSVKSVSDYIFRGPAVLFGDANHTDISPYRDYFTPETDFWLDSYKSRPMIFDHGVIDMEMVDAFEQAAKSSEERDAVREFKAAMIDLDRDPRIGEWTSLTVDPMALWVEGEANKSRKYAAYVKQMVDQGILRLSSDSAVHLVRRQQQPNGANKILRWPIIGVSQTSHAAEPRLAPVAAVKSFFNYLGVTPTNEFVEAVTEGAAATAQSVKAVQLARARLEVQRLKMKLFE